MSTITITASLKAIKTARVESIDLLRGTVIIIMALDHVRDYFHGSAYLFDPTDLHHTSIAIFFTRWITHFCAPVFTFLAGTGARLSGLKRSKKELSFFLLTRGLWLVMLEIFIMNLGWTYNPLYDVVVLQVIWSLGFSMIAMSALIYLPIRFILLIGLVITFGHNALDVVHLHGSKAESFIWSLLHE